MLFAASVAGRLGHCDVIGQVTGVCFNGKLGCKFYWRVLVSNAISYAS